jgi:hypothetical protein
VTSDDINHYVNWTLYAIYGRLAEADQIMRLGLAGIRRVAAMLHKRHPIPATPIYRGMLLDPERPLQADPAFSFLSWSDDVDVARWFGSLDAYISEPFRVHCPEAQGYVLTMQRPAAVLWHYSWADVWGAPLPWMALRHPHIGAEGSRQIAWSLRTQREVITEPLTTLPPAQPVETVPGTPIPELDRRLSPPWVAL